MRAYFQLLPIRSQSREICLCVCVFLFPISCVFFRGLSLALRSHDQIPASHWSTPHNCFKDFGGHLFQRYWRKNVSKILEEICIKDFGRKQFKRFWRKIVSKILEENSFKDFGGFKLFFFLLDKSCNLSKIVAVLLSASVEIFFVFRMRDFCLFL